MRRLGSITFAIALSALAVGARVDHVLACSGVSADVRIEPFACSPCEGNQGEQQLPVYVVNGTVVVTNGRAAPVLGSIVVELQAPSGFKYVPIARQVLNGLGSNFVDTCKGGFTGGPAAGSVVLTDGNGTEIPFDAVKNLPEGTVAINFLASFAGPLPGLQLGGRARVKVYTTAIGVESTLLCSVDADGNGTVDQDVKTLVFQKSLTVPATATLIQP